MKFFHCTVQYEVWICLFRMEKLNDHIYKALLDRPTSDKFQWLSLTFCNFSTKGQIRYAGKIKKPWYYFLNYWTARFSLVKHLLWENATIILQLTRTQGGRFASCENIVPQSQTSSQPPPPCKRLLFNVKASLMIRSSFGIEKAWSLCFMTMIISRKCMFITAVCFLFFFSI